MSEEIKIQVLMDFLEGNILPSTMREVFNRINEKLTDPEELLISDQVHSLCEDFPFVIDGEWKYTNILKFVKNS